MSEYSIAFKRTMHEFLVQDKDDYLYATVTLWKDGGAYEYEIHNKYDVMADFGYHGTAQEAMAEIAEWVEKEFDPNIIVYPDPKIMEKIENG